MAKHTWNMDTSHSNIGFSVRHMMFAKVRGRFDEWTGSIALDDKDLTKSEVNVEISAGSINTGIADRDNHLRSADFLDVDNHPNLTFRSSRIKHQHDEHYLVVGELTIGDTTREVELKAELLGRGKDPWGNQRVAFSATAKLDRREFGLTWNQVLEAGGVLVGESLDIQIEVQAVNASASVAA